MERLARPNTHSQGHPWCLAQRHTPHWPSADQQADPVSPSTHHNGCLGVSAGQLAHRHLLVRLSEGEVIGVESTRQDNLRRKVCEEHPEPPERRGKSTPIPSEEEEHRPADGIPCRADSACAACACKDPCSLTFSSSRPQGPPSCPSCWLS